MNGFAIWVYVFELACLSRNNIVFQDRGGAIWGLFGSYSAALVSLRADTYAAEHCISIVLTLEEQSRRNRAIYRAIYRTIHRKKKI